MPSDDFDRPNETPLDGNGWTPYQYSGCRLVSNHIEGPPGDSMAFYSGATYGDDHESQCTYAASSGLDSGPGVRCSDPGSMNLYLYTPGDSGGAIAKIIVNAYSTIAVRSASWVIDDVVRLVVAGSTLQIFRNGSQIGADATDTSIASGGAPGMFAYASGAQLDNWTDNVGAAPTILPPFRHRVQQV